ncbi:MAG: hypothetical protein R3E84_09640 [Pseudomonadales bacterium]
MLDPVNSRMPRPSADARSCRKPLFNIDPSPCLHLRHLASHRQPERPMVATTVICLLSGISSKAST